MLPKHQGSLIVCTTGVLDHGEDVVFRAQGTRECCLLEPVMTRTRPESNVTGLSSCFGHNVRGEKSMEDWLLIIVERFFEQWTWVSPVLPLWWRTSESYHPRKEGFTSLGHTNTKLFKSKKNCLFIILSWCFVSTVKFIQWGTLNWTVFKVIELVWT